MITSVVEQKQGKTQLFTDICGTWYSIRLRNGQMNLEITVYIFRDVCLVSPTFPLSIPSSLLLPLPTSSNNVLPSKKYSPIGPLGWVGGPQVSDTRSGPMKRGLGGGWEAGGAAAVVTCWGGVRVQPAEVQASRVKEYAVHGSKRRNRKLRDSPLNSRFPSLYRLYIWEGKRKEKHPVQQERKRRWVNTGQGQRGRMKMG